MATSQDDSRVSAEEQILAETDQTLADLDQNEADLDQSAADVDQSASDSEQRASDLDQATADKDEESGSTSPNEAARYRRSRTARKQGTSDRHVATETRSVSAHARDDAAARRDRVAGNRDETARARDQLAVGLDEQLARLALDEGPDGVGRLDPIRRAVRNARMVLESSARAAQQRDLAARDREGAAEDRRLAALDRKAMAEELSREGIDKLTGTLRRDIGLKALQREFDRTARTGEGLVIVFIDVDRLKQINDTHGHQAGDALLAEVAATIEQHLRSYDTILRYGGDEFVCALTGEDVSISSARHRFKEICADLAEASDATIGVGFAEIRDADSVEELIRLADTAMLAAKQAGQ